MKTEKNEFSHVVRASAGKSRPAQLLYCLRSARAMWDNPCRSIQLGAVVDLYLAVEGYSRQCHSSQIMEELKLAIC